MSQPLRNPYKTWLRDLPATGTVQVCGCVCVRQHPNRVATMMDGTTVTCEGQQLAITTWSRQMTGWRPITIYEHGCLERTGQTLESLRIAA
jgi:hypothetical protein